MTAAEDTFRLLVVDDEKEVKAEHVDVMFETEAETEVIGVGTQKDALARIEEQVFDAAIVDIELDVPAGGYEVLRKFSRTAPETPIVVYTQHVDPAHVRDLLDLVNEEPPLLVAIVEKGPLGVRGYDPRALRLAIDPVIEGWRASRVRIDGGELPLGLLAARAARIPGYRSEPGEVARELDRICRRLFGDVSGLAAGAEIGVEFKPISGEGLSSAITVEAEVSLGEDAAGSPVGGSRCVLKIGPAAEIRQEVERYSQFVKYGVRLRQRVELLGHTCPYALGAVCYSFAGGVFGEDLISLSELFADPVSEDLAREAIGSLFDPSSRSWHSINCPRESPLSYATETYNTDFGACFTELDNSLAKLERRLRLPELSDALGGYIGYRAAEEGRDGELEIGGTKLTIPRKNIFGGAKFLAAMPARLVHGDMHGSNVMLELSTGADGDRSLSRVCLIDYRSAGPGPRATDFLTLQASIRIADAKAIVRDILDGREEASFTDAGLAAAIARAAGRRDAEAARLEEPEVEPGNRHGVPYWEVLDYELVHAMQENFSDMAMFEYLASALPFTMRYFGYRIEAVTRVRLLAWLSAQFGMFRAMTTA
jgi:CheY-like chemotaxis protein